MIDVIVFGTRVRLWGSPPFTARSASDRTDDWPIWYVTDDGRRNVLRFPDKSGAVLTSREDAEEIAKEANAKVMG
jgi:hypothetical protein